MSALSNIPLKQPADYSAEFLVMRDETGRTVLTFDVTEDGVKLDYDQKDLPIIQAVAAKYKRGQA